MTDSAGPATLRAAFHAVWAPRLHVGLVAADDEPIGPATLRAARYKAGCAAFAAGQSVLEVGCGFGADAALLAAEQGCRVVACDLEGWRLAQSTAPPGVALLQADHQRLPFAGQCFDGAWACETLSYGLDTIASLTELARVVRADGRAVVQELCLGEGRDPLPAMRLTSACQLLPLALWRHCFDISGWDLLRLEDWSVPAGYSYRAVAAALDGIALRTAAVAEALRNMVARQALVATGELGCFFALLRRRA